jgi:hypothetical protein
VDLACLDVQHEFVSDFDFFQEEQGVRIGEIPFLDLDDIPDDIGDLDREYVRLSDEFPKSHHLTVEELGMVEPGRWLNDTLIDLMMG